MVVLFQNHNVKGSSFPTYEQVKKKKKKKIIMVDYRYLQSVSHFHDKNCFHHSQNQNQLVQTFSDITCKSKREYLEHFRTKGSPL